MYVQVCVLSTCVWQVVVVLLYGRLLVGLILSNRLQLTDLSHGVLDSLRHLQHNTKFICREAASNAELFVHPAAISCHSAFWSVSVHSVKFKLLTASFTCSLNYGFMKQCSKYGASWSTFGFEGLFRLWESKFHSFPSPLVKFSNHIL